MRNVLQIVGKQTAKHFDHNLTFLYDDITKLAAALYISCQLKIQT